MELKHALEKQKHILEEKGYTVAYICVYGSQNYGLDLHTDEYQSDIDMKAIVVPTLDDLVRNSKPVSEVFETEWGQCDVKDIRKYFETLLKANPAYMETLFTPYHIIDERFKKEFLEIMCRRDELVEALRCQLIRAMYGMMCEKQKAMKHPYPTIVHKIEKWGYDGKQVHHIVRLHDMMRRHFQSGKTYGEAMLPFKGAIKILMDYKLNRIPLEFAEKDVATIMEVANEFKKQYLERQDEKRIDYRVKEDFLNLSQDIIKKKIIEECKRG